MTTFTKSETQYIDSRCGALHVPTITERRENSINSNWKSLVSKGEFKPPLPYVRYLAVRTYSEITDTQGGNIHACWGGIHHKSSDVTNVHNIAVRKFYANARKLSTASLGVTGIEMKSTVGLVAQTATRLATSFSHLKNGKWAKAFGELIPEKRVFVGHHRNASYRQQMVTQRKFAAVVAKDRKRSSANRLDFAASTWLELEFGWKPMLDDIHAIAETAANHLHAPKPDLIRLGGFHEGKCGITTGSEVPKVSQSRGVTSTNVVAHYTVDSQNLFNLNKWGLVNPAAIGWATLPFSFVVDWFSPVSHYLESFSHDAGLKEIGSSVSIKYHVVGRAWYEDEEAYNCSGTLDVKSFTRDTSGIPSFPLPEVNFSTMLEPWKITTSLALLRSVFFSK